MSAWDNVSCSQLTSWFVWYQIMVVFFINADITAVTIQSNKIVSNEVKHK